MGDLHMNPRLLVATIYLSLVIAATRVFAAELTTQPTQPSDWARDDRLTYATSSLNAESVSVLRRQLRDRPNTFITAFDFNLKNMRASEYRTVLQRTHFYDYASLLLEEKRPTMAQTGGIRFFHATTIVTGWQAVGAVDNPA